MMKVGHYRLSDLPIDQAPQPLATTALWLRPNGNLASILDANQHQTQFQVRTP